MPRLLTGPALLALALPCPALAADEPPVTLPEPAAAATTAPAEPAPPEGKVKLSGYIEVFYQWNFARPSNGVTAYRGFDTRHNSVTLSNAVLDASWERGPLSGRLALQAGHTPETYYLSEPSSPGAGSTGDVDRDVWKFFQQATAGYRPSRAWLAEAGLFLSPIGYEGMAIKDQWSWSRTNLFYGLPFYHTGGRVTYAATERLSATAAVYNGWNSVVDSNDEKSVSLGLLYSGKVTASLLYFGGVERPRGAPEGRAWRHLLDAYVMGQPLEALKLYTQVNGGFERNAFGTSWWAAAVASAQLRLGRRWFAAVRGDLFRERSASNASGRAADLFWPAAWVSSQTATLEARPVEGLSVRLEFRHDQAASAMYFRGAVDPEKPAPNSDSQDTLTLGATSWF